MISLFLALIMAVSLCVTPVSALDLPDGITDFYDWTLRNGGKPAELFWKAIYGDSWDAYLPENKEDAVSKYEEYVNGLQTDLGTTTVVDGGIRLYFKPKGSFESSSYFTDSGSTFGDDYVHVLGMGTQDFDKFPDSGPSVRLMFNTPIVVPFSATCYTGFEYAGNAKYIYVSAGDKLYSGQTVASGKSIYVATENGYENGKLGLNVIMWYAITTSEVVRAYADFIPLEGNTLPTTQDISTDSRSASVLGNLGIIGDDGQITKIQDNSSALIDEFNKVYWNPVTNEQQAFTQYTYNYEDRSYNLTLENGSTVKVVYGDENITINEGDTIYNVYYLMSDSESGGSGGGSGSDGEIGDAVSGLLGGLGNILAGLIEGLLKMAAQAVEALGGLIDIFNGLVDMILGFFSGFTGFLGSMFPFLPEETFVILNFGLILLIAAAVIKKLFL